MSLFFYAWWDWRFLPVLILSVLFNYGISHWMVQAQKTAAAARAKLLLTVGITVNLAYLGWFKYALFIATISHDLFETGISQFLSEIVLPLGISFFTFTQIAFLVDVWRDHSERPPFSSYLLFVTYFPHLIAGPILHHKEMMPQFNNLLERAPNLEKLGIGLSIFVLGLAKKMLIADSVAIYSDQVFNAAGQGTHLSILEGWCGALAYTVQIYFDFSGYSDMAIGLSYMLGIRLPFNFNSPYKANSIIDFWRRWHITLSRFLRDYLYIPLGGNRRGLLRRHVNLLTTMLLGGLWHGAGWTFVIWGGLHGMFLIVNHVWRNTVTLPCSSVGCKLASRALTFLAVIVAWVFFRASDLEVAFEVLGSMVGVNGFDLPSRLEPLSQFFPAAIVRFEGISPNSIMDTWALTGVLAMVLCTWMLPNTQEIFRRQDIGLSPVDPLNNWMSRFAWRSNMVWASGLGAAAAFALFYTHGTNQFLYFNF